MRKFRPILMKTPLVIATKQGRKTETRRTKKLEGWNFEDEGWQFEGVERIGTPSEGYTTQALFRWTKNPQDYSLHTPICPYGNVGDVLWVRETWRRYWVTDPETGEPDDDHIITEYKADGCKVINEIDGDGFQVYNKDGSEKYIPWRSSLHMPKEAARLFLEIVEICCERLNDITEEDAIAEGIELKDGYYKNYLGYSNFLDTTKTSGGIMQFKGTPAPIASFATLWASINGVEAWQKNPYVWVIKYKVIDKPVDFLPSKN